MAIDLIGFNCYLMFFFFAGLIVIEYDFMVLHDDLMGFNGINCGLMVF